MNEPTAIVKLTEEEPREFLNRRRLDRAARNRERSVGQMNSTELMERKKWYMEEVRECLADRGMTREKADALIRGYKLQERLDTFPDVQMHYAIEVAADEIVMEMTRTGMDCDDCNEKTEN